MKECPQEARDNCPLSRGCVGQDTHHTLFPRRDYKTNVERAFRELPINKVVIPRCLHDAIHASGYVPEKPFRQEMASEMWNGAITERSQTELEHQIALGEMVLRAEWPEDAA
jgi:hypothetical protein